MIFIPYEYHDIRHYNDPEIKIIFHEDKITKETVFSSTHWHKSPELLLIKSGSLNVLCDGVETKFNENEIAVINGNQIHDFSTNENECLYFCIIIDPEIFDGKKTQLPHKVTDNEIVKLYVKIIDELKNKEQNYKEAIIGYTKVLITLISRLKSEENIQSTNDRKIELVKSITEYIYENYTKNITLDEICEKFNTSKYYLCHIFKEITGNTIISHVNYLRCHHAYSLLKSGKCNVSESAFLSGFTNLSYFSKIYKNVIGNPPKKDFNMNNRI